MTRTAIFLDASYWVALANKDDHHHARAVSIAVQIAHRAYGDPLTSDYVFDEVVGVALRKAGLKTAIELGESILASESSLVSIGSHIFNIAWKLFAGQRKTTLSFTDCTNIALMRTLSIDKIATFDKAFRKVEGIVVIA